MSKTTKLILLINSGIILVLLVIGGYLWFAQSQLFVKAGLAQNKFPFKMYTAFELSGMYSQDPLENIATTQTPEQTHALFISALRKGDIDDAVECCVLKSEKNIIKKELERIKKSDKFMIMLKDIENISSTNDQDNESKRVFTYFIEDKGEKFGQSFIFQKNLDGVWMIESF